MSKLNGYSRDSLSSTGLQDLLRSWVDQPLNHDSDSRLNSLTTAADVIVGGDLTVNGTTTHVNTIVTDFQDNILLINANNMSAGVLAGLAGLQVDRGTLTDFQSVFQESSELYKIGFVNNLQAVATRDDSPLNNGIMTYSTSTGKLLSTTNIVLGTTFSAGITGTSSTGNTVDVTGTLGTTLGILTDAPVSFKTSSGYTSYISSNSTNNNMTVHSAGQLALDPTTRVFLSSDIPIVFSDPNYSIKYESSVPALTLSSANVIKLSSGTGLPVILRTSSQLQFGTNQDYIVYDGTNLNISATNKLSVAPITQFTNSTASSSNSTGSMLLAGSIAISNTTDATSATNGGTFTSAGGGAFAKQLYIGGKASISDTSPTSINTLGGISAARLVKAGTSNYSGLPSIPVQLTTPSITFTDNSTTASGTASSVNFTYFSQPTLAATNTSITTTSASTVTIQGAPVAGTNETITNAYALQVLAGPVSFGDALTVQGPVNAVSSVTANSVTSNTFVSIGSSGNYAPVANTGKFLNVPAVVATDNVTAAFGTAPEFVMNFMGASTLASASAVTTTNASTLVIQGAPITGTNQTITNAYALWIKSGKAKIDAPLDVSGLVTLGNALVSTSTTDSSSTITGAVITSGGLAVAKKAFIGGTLNITDTTDAVSTSTGSITTLGGLGTAKQIFAGDYISSNKGASLAKTNFLVNSIQGTVINVNQATVTDNVTIASGTAVLNSTVYLGRPTFAAVNSSVTTTSAATMYIQGAPLTGTNQTITNTFALLIAQGSSNLQKVLITDSTSASSTTTGALTVVGGISTQNNLYVAGNTVLASLSTSGQVTLSSTAPMSLTTTDVLTASTTSTATFHGDTSVTLSSGGNASVSGTGASINSGSGALSLTAGAGITISTSDTTNGVTIATSVPNVPVFIGASSGQVTIGNNLRVTGDLDVRGTTATINSTLITTKDNAMVVNSLPSGLSDGGVLVRRYQLPNDVANGRVVSDTPYSSSTFGTGSAIPSTLVLNASEPAVTDYYKGWFIKITSGSGNSQVRRIKSFDASTKTATIYITSDNTEDFADGLDLTIAPVSGNSYSLYPGTYQGFFFDDTDGEWVIGNVPFDTGAGRFPLKGYANFHINNLTLAGALTVEGATNYTGTLQVNFTDTTAFIATKDNSSLKTFWIDTATPNVYSANPTSTVNSTILFSSAGLNSSVLDETYSQFKTTILNSTVGTQAAKLVVALDVAGALVDQLTFNSSTNITTFAPVSSLAFQNTTASSSSSVASAVYSGGISISNTTDASSATNGGTFTSAGGGAFAKSLYIGGTLTLSNALSVGSGGTGATSFTANAVLLGNTSGAIIASGASYSSNTLNIPNASLTGTVTVTNNADATSTATGTITTSGGVGIAKTCYANTYKTPSADGYVMSKDQVLVTSGAYTGFGSYGMLIDSGYMKLTVPQQVSAGFKVSTISASSALVDTFSIDANSHVAAFTCTTDASSLSTAALKVAGGLAVTKQLYLGNNVLFDTDSSISLPNGNTLVLGNSSAGANISLSTNLATNLGALVISAGNNSSGGTVSIATANTVAVTVNYDTSVSLSSTLQATSTTAAAVMVAGGLGVVKNIYAGADLHLTGTLYASTTTLSHSSLQNLTADDHTQYALLAGRAAANQTLVGSTQSAGNLVLRSTSHATKGSIIFDETTASSSTSTGSILVAGSIAISNTTNATSATNGGTITTAGGAAIGNKLYVGTTAYIGSNLAVNTTSNINSAITLAANSNIGVDTLTTADTGSLSISGGGIASGSRGGFITVYGSNHATQANNIILTTSSGSVKINSNASFSSPITSTDTTASSSNSTGSLLLAGSIAISNTTDATSATNGGTISTAGGLAVAKSAYIGGTLTAGSVSLGVTSPTLLISNLVNASATSSFNVKATANGIVNTLSGVISVTPNAGNTTTTIDVALPAASNFANHYDVVTTCGNAYVFATPVNIENVFCYAISGTKTIRFSFTAANTSDHFIHFNSVF